MDFDERNRQTIEEFRANRGVVGGMFKEVPLALLHIELQARTSREIPVVVLERS